MLVAVVIEGSQQSICSCDGVPRPRGHPSPSNHLALTEIGVLISLRGLHNTRRVPWWVPSGLTLQKVSHPQPGIASLWDPGNHRHPSEWFALSWLSPTPRVRLLIQIMARMYVKCKWYVR